MLHKVSLELTQIIVKSTSINKQQKNIQHKVILDFYRIVISNYLKFLLNFPVVCGVGEHRVGGVRVTKADPKARVVLGKLLALRRNERTLGVGLLIAKNSREWAAEERGQKDDIPHGARHHLYGSF